MTYSSKTLSLLLVTFYSAQSLATSLVEIPGAPGTHSIFLEAAKQHTAYSSTTVSGTCSKPCGGFAELSCPDGEYTYTYSCDQEVSLPYTVFEYDVEATVNVTVLPAENGEELTAPLRVTLSGDEVEVTTSETKWLAVTKTTYTKSPVRRRLMEMRVDVTITPIEKQKLVDSLTVREMKYNKGILSYQSGVLHVMPVSHWLTMTNPAGFFRSGLEQTWTPAGPHFVTTPFAGGLQHTIDMKAAGFKFLRGKNTISLSLHTELVGSDLGIANTFKPWQFQHERLIIRVR
jgi:hypothetical protein